LRGEITEKTFTGERAAEKDWQVLGEAGNKANFLSNSCP
jgi:hypothetical protein